VSRSCRIHLSFNLPNSVCVATAARSLRSDAAGARCRLSNAFAVKRRGSSVFAPESLRSKAINDEYKERSYVDESHSQGCP
jgi:hypothetical protein